MIDPLSPSLLAVMYVGDVVFAVSGALVAARLKMDVVGFVLFGTLTGIGGGTLRDLLLDRTVWWTENPLELLLCAGAALLTFLVAPRPELQRRGLVWADAMGLSAFCVVGCHIALAEGVPVVIAVFMGALTATGGGVIRDVVAGRRPMITQGHVYATAAFAGAATYAILAPSGLPALVAELAAFATAFALRALGIVYRVRLGPPGRFLTVGGDHEDD